ncbi:MAG: UDP-N-acetylglucosamine 2-epimerase (non-hydrolyzing) [Candidatus Hydrothermarchaeota archaeon]|nr:MAG: UDP-N-acetylglucosamine 2-epimerase (non-hydrolyzing) [Candidatus Hydrothermarchaeota archaeon]
MKALVVASTRPEVIKLAPVLRELEKNKIEYRFITTGQHYDRMLFDKFIEELELRKPDYNIEVGSGTQAYQTSQALLELERIFLRENPNVVIVQGDTNSTLSSALAAIKLHIPVAHVEAGLRSFDKRMPEEINRIIADHCSMLLFAPTEKAALNLITEGIFPEKVFIVGNTIVDAVLQNIEIAKRKSSIKEKDYILLTLHRAENVDNKKILENIVDALISINKKIIFPVHPRTKKRLEEFKLLEKLKNSNIKIIEPLGYLDFLLLLSNAKLVLTDSGGVQEEAIILHVPCVTLRTTTERPETIEAGGNVLAGVEKEGIVKTLNSLLFDEERYAKMKKAKNPFGDGKSGERIVSIILDKYEKGELIFEETKILKGWKREIIKVNEELEGKEIKELDFKVLRMIDGKEIRFPYGNLKLKKGQLIEIFKIL